MNLVRALGGGDTQLVLLAMGQPLIRGQRVVALTHQTSAPDVEEDVCAVCAEYNNMHQEQKRTMYTSLHSVPHSMCAALPVHQAQVLPTEPPSPVGTAPSPRPVHTASDPATHSSVMIILGIFGTIEERPGLKRGSYRDSSHTDEDVRTTRNRQ
ncbi:uncharacterized protein BT62DRAFT_698686 [Guyanagaster necrorhizus]|uniref:Uncharacterized protein n=1 Tax=Guyanagaster necrorhizus TaxID=856835 RepID=A0A9P7VET8_9AGAR|nr:uncharacterized protein BT62DRAFT_698686 [Guyanagaster necrorhizus MCA 3950]KAG7439618.1 hypothetical protein BT62DRAFT_698686 [Guyanagaster necrorhizus MCA 3950]